MCQLHPSSIYHFPVEVPCDFSGSLKASVVPIGAQIGSYWEAKVYGGDPRVDQGARTVEECDSF